jgi:hypothetical protein
MFIEDYGFTSYNKNNVQNIFNKNFYLLSNDFCVNDFMLEMNYKVVRGEFKKDVSFYFIWIMTHMHDMQLKTIAEEERKFLYILYVCNS